MYTDIEFRAILIADCGIERTRVSLIDLIEGSLYRLVGQHELPTTAEPPFSDVMTAVRDGIVGLERKTGRHLLEDGRLRIPQGRDGQGLDAFVATCSAAGALPVLVMAVTADITAQTAVRAIEGVYAVPFRVVTMEEVLRDDPLAEVVPDAERTPWWRVFEELYPGGVLMVGGVGGGNVAPLRTLARVLAEALPPKAARFEQQVARPALPLIYAGNERAQDVIQQYLGERVDLHIVDNVRPRLREEQIQTARQEVARLYDEQLLQSLGGYEELSSWAQTPLQLPYVGLQLVARFLAGHHQSRVLALDLGSGATSMIWADPERWARVVLGHFGLGYGVARVLSQRGAERIKRWVPFPISLEEIRDWVLNQSLRSRTIPVTVRDFLIQQAVAREALAEIVEKIQEQAPLSAELIVATGGGVARAPRLAQSLLMVLDALQPSGDDETGIVHLYLDRSCLLPSVGVLSTVNPDAAASVLLQDGLYHLGPCLVPLGSGRTGARALDLVLEFEDGMRQHLEVSWGEVVCVPFRWGAEAHLTVKPARRTRLGLGHSGEMLTTKGGEPLRGGALGLIVDARGRPLVLPEDEQARIEQLQRWLKRCEAYTAEELDGLMPLPFGELEAGDIDEVAVKGEVAAIADDAAEERLPWE